MASWRTTRSRPPGRPGPGRVDVGGGRRVQAYFCMYAFRKPFTAAEFATIRRRRRVKAALVIAQVIGYTLAKFIGIKVIAEMRPHRRAAWLVGLIVVAEAALGAFAVVPMPVHLVCLFVNGLALGMVFGLVLGFLEGRRQTEALTAGLCASFIVADGVVRSAGGYVLEAGATDFTMPALTGLAFFLPFLVFVRMLTRVPVPSAADRAARTERVPMTGAERRAFFRRYAVGLLLIVGVYLLVTILRTVRSDFAREIWTGLGTKVEAKVFAQSEMVVGASVLVLAGLAVFIRTTAGRSGPRSGWGCRPGLVGIALLAVGSISPFAFMVLPASASTCRTWWCIRHSSNG